MNFSLLVINRIKFLAIYQIAGGIIGFLLVGWFFLQFGSISGIYLFAPLIAFFLFGYSIYCGVILLQKKESGIRLSLISQWLQLFGFIFFGYGFKFASGVFISIGIDLSREVEFALNFGISTWQMDINSENTIFLINFNFIALSLIIFITKLQQRIEKEKMLQLMELGKETKPHASSPSLR